MGGAVIFTVFLHDIIVGSIGDYLLWIRNHIYMMDEDPEDFFGDVDNLLTPNTVRSWMVHRGYEAWRLSFFGFGWIAKVSDDIFGSSFVICWRWGREMNKKKTHYYVTGREFIRPLSLLVEEHVKDRREERRG